MLARSQRSATINPPGVAGHLDSRPHAVTLVATPSANSTVPEPNVNAIGSKAPKQGRLAMSSVVRWACRVDDLRRVDAGDVWMIYDSTVAALLERGFAACSQNAFGTSSEQFCVRGIDYRVEYSTMEQINLQTGRRRPVGRVAGRRRRRRRVVAVRLRGEREQQQQQQQRAPRV